MNNKKKILVTGASGFLGSLMVTQLIKEHEVVALYRRNTGFLEKDTLNQSNLKLVQCDLTKSTDLNQLVSFELSGIFHLASQQPSKNSLGYKDYYDQNVIGTQNIINLAKKSAVSFLGYSSTTSVFGNVKKPLNESTSVAPNNYYGLTKYTSEKLIEIELAKSGTKSFSIRFPSIFGKNHLGGLVYSFYEVLRENKPLSLYNEGLLKRNLVYSHDAVKMLETAARSIKVFNQYELFIAGSQDSLTTLQTAKTMKKHLNSTSELVPVKAGSGTDILIDMTKFQRLTGFAPSKIETKLVEYIKEMKNVL